MWKVEKGMEWKMVMQCTCCIETSYINEVPLDVRESCTLVACNSCKAKWPETERE